MPGFFMEDDVQALIDDAGGIPMTIGATTAKVLVDVADQELLDQGVALVAARVVDIRAKTGTFATLAEGVSVTLDWPTNGTSYKVISQHRIEDGAVTLARLATP